MNVNTPKIKVAIVDDHAMVRFGLRKMLDAIENIEVVIEAANGKEFIDQLSLEPHLVIMDINMPVMNGEDAVRQARMHLPGLKVLILSMNNDERYFKAMNELGVDGYIIKESEYEELEHAIATVLKGGKYFSQELLLDLVNNNKPSNKNIDLTEREKEVLNYLCKGYSVKEIGEKLFISPRTVEKHRSDLFLRTATSTSISLVVYAIKNGLVRI